MFVNDICYLKFKCRNVREGCSGIAFLCVGSLHQPDARGDTEGGCYRRKYGDGEVDDLSENCRYDLAFPDNVKELAEWLREEDEYADW